MQNHTELYDTLKNEEVPINVSLMDFGKRLKNLKVKDPETSKKEVDATFREINISINQTSENRQRLEQAYSKHDKVCLQKNVVEGAEHRSYHHKANRRRSADSKIECERCAAPVAKESQEKPFQKLVQ